jgi:hypothetical protein
MAEGGIQTHAIEADSPVGKVLADSAPSIRVVDSAAAARDLVEADTKLRPDAPARTAPAVAHENGKHGSDQVANPGVLEKPGGLLRRWTDGEQRTEAHGQQRQCGSSPQPRAKGLVVAEFPRRAGTLLQSARIAIIPKRRDDKQEQKEQMLGQCPCGAMGHAVRSSANKYSGARGPCPQLLQHLAIDALIEGF